MRKETTVEKVCAYGILAGRCWQEKIIFNVGYLILVYASHVSCSMSVQKKVSVVDPV